MGITTYYWRKIYDYVFTAAGTERMSVAEVTGPQGLVSDSTKRKSHSRTHLAIVDHTESSHTCRTCSAPDVQNG